MSRCPSLRVLVVGKSWCMKARPGIIHVGVKSDGRDGLDPERGLVSGFGGEAEWDLEGGYVRLGDRFYVIVTSIYR